MSILLLLHTQLNLSLHFIRSRQRNTSFSQKPWCSECGFPYSRAQCAVSHLVPFRHSLGCPVFSSISHKKALFPCSAANAPAAPPRLADLIQPSVAPESKCRARGYPVQFTVY